MIQIAPSILSADFLHLSEDVDLVNRHADLFHLDIMDGSFVPNISFGFPVVEAIAREARRPLDVHLMIVDPGKYIERFAQAGAAMISFHYEAALDESDSIIDLIHSFGVKAGIVINPDCPVEKIFPYLDKVDFVLLMSVFAGFGGQKFIPESLERIRSVRKELDRRGRRIPIEVDGGISPDNARSVIGAGAEILVAGSSVFKAADPAAAIAAMRL
jgi:ribulose-phosphate 3-epimerase